MAYDLRAWRHCFVWRIATPACKSPPIRGNGMEIHGRVVPPRVPPDLWSASMVLDSIRGVCVLFTQTPVGGTSGTVWEWNGTNWTARGFDTPFAIRPFHGVRFCAWRVGSLGRHGTQRSAQRDLGVEWNILDTGRATRFRRSGVASVFDPGAGHGASRRRGPSVRLDSTDARFDRNESRTLPGSDCVNGVAVQDVFAFVNSWFARSSFGGY